MPKRNNLRSTICPICGHIFTLKDFKPVKTFKDMFGYADNGFYGGRAQRFSKAECCRKYIIYWKRKSPSFEVLDIEPVDFERFVKDLSEVANGRIEAEKPEEKADKQEKPKKANKQAENTPKIKKNVLGIEIDEDMDRLEGMNFLELKKYIADKYDVKFANTVKKAEIFEWLKENS
jgi:hypothetical protein